MGEKSGLNASNTWTVFGSSRIKMRNQFKSSTNERADGQHDLIRTLPGNTPLQECGSTRSIMGVSALQAQISSSIWIWIWNNIRISKKNTFQ